jgi:hypothetical protein
LKAILLNKVVVGKGYKMTQDNTTMTAPPAGYDSVRFNDMTSVFVPDSRIGSCRERIAAQP